MPKVIYPVKQVNLPIKAHELIQEASDNSPDGVRKADLWVHAAMILAEKVENDNYGETIKKELEE